MIDRIDLDRGLTAWVETVPSARSVCLGVVVASGSRHEPAGMEGASHFLEHLLFRGTGTHTSAELDEAFDSMGGAVEAMTDRESTTLMARVARDDAPRAFALIADMVVSPALASIEAERAVILEELAMVDDDPSERLAEAMSMHVFGADPLGRPVAGTVKSVESIEADSLRRFHRQAYVRSRVIPVAAGAIDRESFRQMVADGLMDLPGGDPTRTQTAPVPTPSRFDVDHDSEQVHLQVGGIAPPRESEDRWAMRVLDCIFGGAVSSRLFRRIREELGLAYDTGSFFNPTLGASEWGAWLATRPDRAAEAAEALGAEIVAIRERGITEIELDSAKRHLRARHLLATEGTSERAASIASRVSAGLPPLRTDEVIRSIDCVEARVVNELSAAIFDPSRLVVGALGPGARHASTLLETAASGSLGA